MKKSADISLSVLLTVTTAVLFLTLSFTLVTGESPYETLGIDACLGTLGTLCLVALLLIVPYVLNHDFRGNGPLGSKRLRRRS